MCCYFLSLGTWLDPSFTPVGYGPPSVKSDIMLLLVYFKELVTFLCLMVVVIPPCVYGTVDLSLSRYG